MPTITRTKPKAPAKRTAAKIAKASAKKTPAKKPAPKAAASPAEIGLTEMTVDELWPSPLNPRKSFDPDAINELAASIKADGQVYQNLVARANPGPDGASHEIIAGERRFRSVSQLIAAGDWDPSKTLPVRVIVADDAKVIEIATLENMQRRDLTPLEEARAFAQLRDLGRTTDQIADAVGMSLRHVQVRLQLVDTLTTAGQAAMDRGDISLAQARKLMLEKDADRQNGILQMVLNPAYLDDEWTPEQIREKILEDTVAESTAIFDTRRYTGGYIVDNGDEEVRYFEDVAQFEALQEAAIGELEAELKQRFAWVKRERGYFSRYQYDTGGSPEEAGAVIEIGYGLSVKVHEGLINRQAAPGVVPAKTAPAPQPPFTKAQLSYAKNRKTEALQAAVAQDPRTAKVLACLALMGADGVTRIQNADIGADDRVRARELGRLEDSVAERLPASVINTDKDIGGGLLLKSASEWRHYVDADTELEAYEAVRALDDADLDSLFTALVAGRVGTFDGFPPRLGDRPLAVKLAQDLHVDMSARWFIDDEYLQLLRKPRLREIIDTGWPTDDPDILKERDKMTAKQLRTAITLRAHMVLPREMQFGSEKELEDGKAINFGPGATV